MIGGTARGVRPAVGATADGAGTSAAGLTGVGDTVPNRAGGGMTVVIAGFPWLAGAGGRDGTGRTVGPGGVTAGTSGVARGISVWRDSGVTVGLGATAVGVDVGVDTAVSVGVAVAVTVGIGVAVKVAVAMTGVSVGIVVAARVSAGTATLPVLSADSGKLWAG